MKVQKMPSMKFERQIKWKKAIIPWLFVLPGMLITLLLRYVTMGTTIVWSFHNVKVGDIPGTFIGLRNYSNLFTSSAFSQAFLNTLIYVGLTFLICFPIPLIQAVILSEIHKEKLKNIFTTLYIIPAVIPGTILIVIWKWIWNPQYGIANLLLKFFGMEPQIWLANADLVKMCIVLPGILGGGFTVMLYYAAILGIPQDVVEASRLDGCAGFKKLRYITFPNIRFILMVQVITTMIGTFQISDSIFQYTNGGPAGASSSLGLSIYQFYMEQYEYGKGSALSVILLVVIAVLTMIQLCYQNRNED